MATVEQLTDAEKARLAAVIEKIDYWGKNWQPGLVDWLSDQPKMYGALRDCVFRELSAAGVSYRAIEEATGWSRGAVYGVLKRPILNSTWGAPGVYVYSFPRYLKPPALFKIGRAGSDVTERIRQQVRSSAMPEDPVLLRIYQSDISPRVLERLLHRGLNCPRAPGRLCGAEWFSTDLATIDACARSWGASVIFEVDP